MEYILFFPFYDHGMLNFSILAQSKSVLFKEVGLALRDSSIKTIKGWVNEPLINPQLMDFIQAHEEFEFKIFEIDLFLSLEHL